MYVYIYTYIHTQVGVEPGPGKRVKNEPSEAMDFERKVGRALAELWVLRGCSSSTNSSNNNTTGSSNATTIIKRIIIRINMMPSVNFLILVAQ